MTKIQNLIHADVSFRRIARVRNNYGYFDLERTRTNERRAEMAKLLDRPFTNDEKRQILDMMHGNINRISVSDDIEEIVCQLNFAVDRLTAVAYSRIKELKGDGDGEINTVDR